jgi:hypothetical protein
MMPELNGAPTEKGEERRGERLGVVINKRLTVGVRGEL